VQPAIIRGDCVPRKTISLLRTFAGKLLMSDVATEHSAVAIRSAGLTSLKTDAEEETPSPANHVDEADEEEDAPNWLAFANYAK